MHSEVMPTDGQHRALEFGISHLRGHSADDRTQGTNNWYPVLEAMPTGVILLSVKGVVEHANQMAKTILGEPLVGQLWREVIARAFRPQKDDGHEISLVDGRRVQIATSQIPNQPGQLILLTDLTETRLLQQRISHMQRLSSLGKMVASLAHQVRTPLSAAMLYAANLKNPTLNEHSRNQFCDKLMNRLKDLESQINDMLLFAKSGEQQVVEEISLEQLLEEVAVGSDAMIQSHLASLKIQNPLHDLIILGNRTALSGALQNMIQNSLHIKPENAKITISASLNERDPDEIELKVTDNGPGIPVESFAHIFEPFYTTKSQGTGLGLAVVKSVIQAHKGRVHARNKLEGGAMFTLTLPVHKHIESAAEEVSTSAMGAM